MICGALLAAAALSLPAQQAAAAPHDPPSQPLSQLLQQLQTLYLQTEQATEDFNKAKEAATKQRAAADLLDKQLADQRVAVAESRDQIGLLARRQYQDGGVSPYLNLLVGDDPQGLFAQKHLLQRAAGNQADVLERLKSGEARISVLNAGAQVALDKAQVLQTQQGAAKAKVEEHLKRVETIIAGLTGVQLEELQKLEEQGINQAQADFLDSKALGAGSRVPSAAGNRAVGYAFLQLGKPYIWGAEGPASYDCSGLTSQAWSHAGQTIPRTSQEQWAQLPKVPLSLLRPGDLVVYFAGATHVAIYIGNGLVIQAPRPGAFVKVSPIAANPILGAVRPDSSQGPMPDYVPMALPKTDSATPISGADSGNNVG
ncbi:C40 family peptidase [Streptomyces sp. H10-C2]|uniref:C40 family peptidase n=1 Tax=unclassified Streptomyces TaxID=2593676 RepID=UPI0024BB706B|nr:MULTISPECIES: C40 family peptidase [unclassified Streptomyces]MDJ0370570.1 C40 family peptidase [Streptomyces sp. H10-C2]